MAMKSSQPRTFFEKGRGQVLWGQKRSPSKTSALKRVKRYRKFLAAGIIFLCIISTGLLFLFGPWLQVTKIELYLPTSSAHQEAVKTLIHESLLQKFGFLSTAHILLVQPRKIEINLRKKFPEIQNVSVTRRLPHLLSVTIEKRSEAALYCIKEGDACYFLDEAGVAWKNAPKISGLLQVKIRGENAPSSLGEEIVPRHIMDIIFDIVVRMRANEKRILFIKEFIIDSSTEIKITSSLGLSIILDTSESIADQLNTLYIILEREIPPEKWENVEYIDLRIPGRVYYKMKGQQ